MPDLPTAPKTEPWLAGYIRRGDPDLEPARNRARKAAVGEALRNRFGTGPTLHVRAHPGTTAAGERVVVDHHGVAVAKPEDDRP